MLKKKNKKNKKMKRRSGELKIIQDLIEDRADTKKLTKI